MNHYRYALRCPHCKKIYVSEYRQIFYILSDTSTSLCPKCGEVSGSFDKVVVKPKLFGLLGWEVKEEEPDECSSDWVPCSYESVHEHHGWERGERIKSIEITDELDVLIKEYKHYGTESTARHLAAYICEAAEKEEGE